MSDGRSDGSIPVKVSNQGGNVNGVATTNTVGNDHQTNNDTLVDALAGDDGKNTHIAQQGMGHGSDGKKHEQVI
jgi:hypothetical protein